MTIIENEKYRLCTITKFDSKDFADQPVKDGLAIEKKCTNDENSWYVIMFVKASGVESIGVRLLDIEDNDWTTVRKLIECAYIISKTANTIEEED